MTSINEGALLMASIEELSLIIKDLESRVRVCEDEREIRELLSRYGYNADCCRDEEYVALWTDDASYDLSLIMTDSTERNETTHSWRGKTACAISSPIRTATSDPAFTVTACTCRA